MSNFQQPPQEDLSMELEDEVAMERQRFENELMDNCSTNPEDMLQILQRNWQRLPTVYKELMMKSYRQVTAGFTQTNNHCYGFFMARSKAMLYAGQLTRLAIIENGVWVSEASELMQDAWLTLGNAPAIPWKTKPGNSSQTSSRSSTPVP